MFHSFRQRLHSPPKIDQPDIARFVTEFVFPLMTRKLDEKPQATKKGGPKKTYKEWVLADLCFEGDERLSTADVVRRAKNNDMKSRNTVVEYLTLAVKCGALEHDKDSGEYRVNREKLDALKNPVDIELGSAESDSDGQVRLPYKD
jgi:hypothetical protein